jgi:hypothetical protein
VVQSDPVDLVAGARLTGNGEAAVGADARGQGRIRLAMPAGGEARGCAALDRHGNFLVGAALVAAPVSIEPVATSTATTISGGGEPEGRPIYARWWLYGGVAALSAGAAVYYGLKVRSTEDELEELNQRTLVEQDHDITWADALALEDRGERYARNTNIALGVTALFVAVSGSLLAHELLTGGDESATRVGAAPLPGGAGVHVSLGF